LCPKKDGPNVHCVVVYFPLSPRGLVVFDPELDEYVGDFVVFDVVVIFELVELDDGLCGWVEACCVLLPVDDALATWNGANRIGGNDMVRVRAQLMENPLVKM
jgi:hypothetical protein